MFVQVAAEAAAAKQLCKKIEFDCVYEQRWTKRHFLFFKQFFLKLVKWGSEKRLNSIETNLL